MAPVARLTGGWGCEDRSERNVKLRIGPEAMKIATLSSRSRMGEVAAMWALAVDGEGIDRLDRRGQPSPRQIGHGAPPARSAVALKIGEIERQTHATANASKSQGQVVAIRAEFNFKVALRSADQEEFNNFEIP